MDLNFKRALPLVLREEGGFVNNPEDPGGATNKGVTLVTFRRYVKPSGTVADLKRLSDDQAATVYYKQYWSVVDGPALPAGVDYCVFDFAVNSGPARAAKYLQAVVGAPQDGKIGPKTVAACEAMAESDIINRLCDRRMAFLRGLKTFDTFGKGWTARVARVRASALGMVGRPADTITKFIDVPKPEPTVPQTVESAVKTQTHGWGWSGVGLGGVGTAITAATGLPWQTVALFAGLAVVGGVVALVVGPLIIQRIRAIREAIEA